MSERRRLGRFTIRVTGLAAHASAPHMGQDAALAGACVLEAIGQLPGRRCDPLELPVITTERFEAGTLVNILAAEAVLEGSVWSATERPELPALLEQTAVSAAASCGCRAELSWIADAAGRE